MQKAARNPEASEAGRRHGLVERRVFVFCDRERAAERELHLGVDEAPEGWQLAEAAHERHPRRGAAEAEHGCCGVRIERGDAADELHLGRPSFQVRGEQRLGLDGSANGDSEKRDVCVALACEAAERGWDLRVVVVVAALSCRENRLGVIDDESKFQRCIAKSVGVIRERAELATKRPVIEVAKRGPAESVEPVDATLLDDLILHKAEEEAAKRVALLHALLRRDDVFSELEHGRGRCERRVPEEFRVTSRHDLDEPLSRDVVECILEIHKENADVLIVPVVVNEAAECLYNGVESTAASDCELAMELEAQF